MAIIITCIVLIILCIMASKKKKVSKNTHICIHTKLDCENCMSQKNCKQQNSPYMIRKERE